MIKRGKLSKRAISNIEMSIALILFIGAVFSIVLIFNSYYKPDKINPAVLDDFERNFLKQAHDYTKVGVYASGNCINVSLNDNLNENTGEIGVFSDNNQVSSNLEDNYLTFEGSVSRAFFEIYEFSFPIVNTVPRGSCNTVDYDYTIQDQGKIFLASELNETVSEFTNTNIKIKDEDNLELVNTNKAPPKGAEVLAKTFFILVYENQINPQKIKNCQVNVQIW